MPPPDPLHMRSLVIGKTRIWGTLPPKPPTGGRSASPRPPAQGASGCDRS
ncbi:hypothetical protein H6F77_08770 [Microcoleus sp. FACHB-831]|nr:hypothetical protein [Microcoleus sp. FACHB-831]MBD1921183.1 hypothetical protein [Microcoleus sp. FACHB-831]